MLSSKRALLLSSGLLILLASSLAHAADEPAAEEEKLQQPDAYFEFIAGSSSVPNQTIRDGGTSQSRVESEPGFMVAGALGTRIFDFFRAELQVGYREADIDKVGLTSSPSTADGETSLITVMANGYVDFDFDIGIVPYAGFGIGWGQYKLDSRRKTAGELDIDDKDSVFVYNAMVGATIPLTQVFSASIGYRYIATSDPDEIGAIVNDTSQDIEAEFDAHEVSLGLRFHF